MRADAAELDGALAAHGVGVGQYVAAAAVAERAQKKIAAPERVHARLADDRRGHDSRTRRGRGDVDWIAAAIVDDGAVGNDARVAADDAQLRRHERGTDGLEVRLSE